MTLLGSRMSSLSLRPRAAARELAEREVLASLQSEDFRDGVAHYLEKRAAGFSGR
jgi:hypothetical protein